MFSIDDKPPDAQAARKSGTLRAELARLQARYDSGAISPAVFSAIRALEIELAWVEHRGAESRMKKADL